MSQILYVYLKFKFPWASCIFFGKSGSPRLWDGRREACKSWQESSASPTAKRACTHTHTHTHTQSRCTSGPLSLRYMKKAPGLDSSPICRSAPGPASMRREHLQLGKWDQRRMASSKARSCGLRVEPLRSGTSPYPEADWWETPGLPSIASASPHKPAEGRDASSTLVWVTPLTRA